MMSLVDLDVLRCYLGSLGHVNLFGTQDHSFIVNGSLSDCNILVLLFLHFFLKYCNNKNEVKVVNSSLLRVKI